MTLKQIRQLSKPKGITLTNLSPYIITEDGSVWSNLRDRYIKAQDNGIGYMQVFLKCDDGTKRWYKIHRLVAMAYIPNPLNKPDIDHIDNNKANNHKDNLQWVTEAENIKLSYTRDGRKPPEGIGHWNYGRKYSDESKAKMSAKKIGVNHPKFKGHYEYNNKLYTSKRSLAIELKASPSTIK